MFLPKMKRAKYAIWIVSVWMFWRLDSIALATFMLDSVWESSSSDAPWPCCRTCMPTTVSKRMRGQLDSELERVQKFLTCEVVEEILIPTSNIDLNSKVQDVSSGSIRTLTL